jgi:hypothetical protein
LLRSGGRSLGSLTRSQVKPKPRGDRLVILGDRLQDSTGRYARAVIRYRLEFVGPGELPLPDYVFRDAPILEGTVELYGARRYVVVGVNETADPPLAVLRKILAV